jgi:hypothetical protein
MDFKKFSREWERINYFKNIALKAGEFCLKDMSSDEISEDEEKCLKKHALNLHMIVERGSVEKYVIHGYPPVPH